MHTFYGLSKDPIRTRPQHTADDIGIVCFGPLWRASICFRVRPLRRKCVSDMFPGQLIEEVMMVPPRMERPLIIRGGAGRRRRPHQLRNWWLFLPGNAQLNGLTSDRDSVEDSIHLRESALGELSPTGGNAQNQLVVHPEK
jgi:hypothetical protein